MGTNRPTRGVKFHLFGFPVRIDWTFFLIVAFIGFGNGAPLSHTLVLGLVIGVSVIVHELGHAFAARMLGARPIIELYAMGGLTMFQTPRTPTRVESIGVSLAGPFAGFALGGLVVATRYMGLEPSSDLGEFAVLVAIYANLVWGAVNLLPILPLDGGNVMRNLLPGDDDARDRRAAIASIAIAAAGAYVMLTRFDNPFAALLLGWVVVMNVGILRSASAAHLRGPDGTPVRSRDATMIGATLERIARGEGGHLAELHQQLANTADANVRNAAKTYAVEQLLRQWRPVEARQAIDHLPGSVPPSLYALVGLVEGDADHALLALDELVHRDPSPVTARHSALGRVLLRRAAEVPGVLGPLPDSIVPFATVRELQFTAHDFGDVVGSAMIGEFGLARFGQDPTTLYNIACSWARAGEYDRAVACLHRAVDAGWRDASQLDRDPDLAPLRGSADFEALRAVLARASYS